MMSVNSHLDNSHPLIVNAMPLVRDNYKLWSGYNQMYHQMFDILIYSNVVVLEDDLSVSSNIHEVR
jgi:hypothetical protein